MKKKIKKKTTKTKQNKTKQKTNKQKINSSSKRTRQWRLFVVFCLQIVAVLHFSFMRNSMTTKLTGLAMRDLSREESAAMLWRHQREIISAIMTFKASKRRSLMRVWETPLDTCIQQSGSSLLFKQFIELLPFL